MSETSTSSFDLNAFIRESKETLLNPKTYFSKMRITGGIAEPLIKAVIYSAVSGFFVFLLSLFGLGAVKFGILGGAIGIMAFVWYIIAGIIGLFIGAVILLLISSISKGSSDFESSVRVVAATMVIMPVNSLLGFTGGISTTLGIIITIIVNLYALYLLYYGLVNTLKAKADTARIAVFVMGALFVIFSIIGLGTRKNIEEFNRGEYKELIDQPQNN